MFATNQIESSFEFASPVLTAYVRTSPSDASSHRLTREYMTSLRMTGRSISGSLRPPERETFLKQLDRVEEFLQQRKPHERGLVIFAGPGIWKTVSLQQEVEDELHWGKPALAQLFWLAVEHKPYGIVVVDHAGARFFRYWLGEIAEYKEKRFAIDISQWKRKDLGHVSGQGVEKTWGSKRDLFEKRIEGQYAHLCHETADHAAKLYVSKEVSAVFLVGPDRLIKPIEAKFPSSFHKPIVLFEQDLARVSTSELLRHLEPQIAAWQRKHQAEVAAGVTGDQRGTVAGFDETLNDLQKGKLRALVLNQGLDATLRQCVHCGWTDRSADPICTVCGSERRSVTFRDALPELARRHPCEIEVVSGDVAEDLNKSGGMAGVALQPRQM
jgi:hypothetical protein